MGVATLIQTTIGNRLPIIQGPSATLTGTLAPVAATLGPGAMWGAAFAGGLAEMAFGASRALNFLRQEISRPTASLRSPAARFSPTNRYDTFPTDSDRAP
jgi:hypothetical protein